MPEIKAIDRFKGSMLGLAVGDALGAPWEFQPIPKKGIADMVENDISRLRNIKKGQWTDDTALALCIADALIKNKKIEYRAIMDNFVKWLFQGFMTPQGCSTGMGTTTMEAILDYNMTGNYFSGKEEAEKAGNGSIMRIAPLALFYTNKYDTSFICAQSSLLTHATPECVEGCALLGKIISRCFYYKSKEDILFDGHWKYDFKEDHINSLIDGKWIKLNKEELRGSAYVIDTLQIAFWCFYHTSSFEDAVKTAVEIYGDTDTQGAVVGQIAGAYYGIESIPEKWLSQLAWRKIITKLAEQLYKISLLTD